MVSHRGGEGCVTIVKDNRRLHDTPCVKGFHLTEVERQLDEAGDAYFMLHMHS